MKKSNLFVSALALLSSVGAFAANGGDGCFQMYRPNELFPAICVSGTLEEGINGSGVRVALVDNVGQVVWCGHTTSSVMGSANPSVNKWTLNFDKASGMISIQFNGATEADGLQAGKITLTETDDKNTLEYKELSAATMARLRGVFDSDKCRNR
jgi:hypothetical protein